MGMYFTIQLATPEWSMMLQIKSIFVILNPENYSPHEKCQKDTQNQYTISYSLLSRIKSICNLYTSQTPRLFSNTHSLAYASITVPILLDGNVKNKGLEDMLIFV